jgi:hypothetical protein
MGIYTLRQCIHHLHGCIGNARGSSLVRDRHRTMSDPPERNQKSKLPVYGAPSSPELGGDRIKSLPVVNIECRQPELAPRRNGRGTA